ncbi:tagaturonate reductase [Poritiphilus flavus]|uniref:Tagaturonate reductase n=1 Tax=Poritiphilus flavus TaxID=2697053 RepID=A0A6L9EC92_9FLAO|nr:tagaturonate reductase [Poritiphilus flavus]NAS12307.1 tagaturonate reductase [Poritiphilus flavus]
MKALNRSTVGITEQLPLKIVQFGGGNFLRAFVDWMIQILNEQTGFNGGIALVKPTAGGDYAALRAQEGLYHLVLDGVSAGKHISDIKLISCVQKIINPYTEWDAYLDLAKEAELRFIVSNTTESGIRFNSSDLFEDHPPKEFPAKLTQLLYQRFEHFRGDPTKGCFLLPCELIVDNAEALRVLILRYADLWNLGEDFKHWINTANAFCNTLVDRIVSGYPEARASEIQSELGFEDQLLVAGEYYHSWVIQGTEEIRQELGFHQTDLNVQFADDLTPFREMKVRILNGAHTAVVPVGYLAGLRYVHEVMDHELVCGFIETLLSTEVIPTLDYPDSTTKKFMADVLDRFRNPVLEHQLMSIALNSTSKFVSRLLPTLRTYYLRKNSLPKHLVYGLAALIVFYRGEFDNKPIELKDNEQVLTFFSTSWARYESKELSGREFIHSVLANEDIWGEDLNSFEGLAELILKYLELIQAKGIKDTLENLD